MIYDVMRRTMEIRNCEECDTQIVVNSDDPEQVDQHHVVGFSDGAGNSTATEYATYVFCSITCFRDWVSTYFQQMLGTDETEAKLTESEQLALHSEG